MIGPEANSEAYALYENTIKASPFRPQGFLWVGKERLFLLHLPLSKRDARKLLLRKPSAAAQGLRVCARWAFRSVSAGSKQSAGLPLVDRAPTCLWQVDGGAALPRLLLCCKSELMPRTVAYCAAVLRSRPWGLCPQTSATFEKVDETFYSRTFVLLHFAFSARGFGYCSTWKVRPFSSAVSPGRSFLPRIRQTSPFTRTKPS